MTKALFFHLHKIMDGARNSLDSLVLLVICVFIFDFLLKNVPTDIQLHIQQVKKINANEASYPSNFAFYLILNLLSSFLGICKIETIAIIILSLAMVLKYVISKKIIVELNTSFLAKQHSANGITLIVLALFFCFSIPDPFSIFILEKFYLGRFVPIVWHNSTTIFLFPFSMLLFWKQLKVFDTFYKSNIRDILVLNILVIVNATIKPSFLFVYIPITFLFLLNKYRCFSRRDFLLNMTPLLTGVLIIISQTFLIYILEVGSFQESDSSISIGYPFKILSSWVPMWYIPISFAISFALPIFTSIVYKEILTYKPYLFALCLTLTGIVISAFVYETGPRMYHGNFMWQNVICTYLLFLSTISFLASKILDIKSWGIKDRIIIGLFALHTLSGILYLIKIVLTFSYF